MSVSTTTGRATFNGSGSTGPFTFSFGFRNNSDIVVTRIDPTGVRSTLTETSDYTLTGAGSSTGGSITLIAALATGYRLEARRILSFVQSTAFRNLGAFFPEMHEDAFDYLTWLIQQVNDTVTATSTIILSGAGAAPTVTNADATSGPVAVSLPASGEVIILKADNTANAVTVQCGTAGQTVMRQTSVDLTVQDESIHLLLVGTDWKKIG